MKKSFIFSIVIVLLLLVYWIYNPLTDLRQRTAVCRVRVTSYYVLPLAGGDTLYLSTLGDSIHSAAYQKDSVEACIEQSGVWISPVGHVLTSAKASGYSPQILEGNGLQIRLQKIDTLLTRHLVLLKSEVRELDYYADRHSVIDDGYNPVMAYRSYKHKLLQQSDSALTGVRKALQTAGLRASLQLKVQLDSKNADRWIDGAVLGVQDSLLLLCTMSHRLPEGATFLPVKYRSAFSDKQRLVAFNDWGGAHSRDTAWMIDPSMPVMPTREGGAIVDRCGFLQGIEVGGHVHALGSFRRYSAVWAPLSWLQSWQMVPRLGKISPHEQEAPYEVLEMENNSHYTGQVRRVKGDKKCIREGHGAWTLQDGTVFSGKWLADSLPEGKRVDKTGIYAGTFNAGFQEEGLGIYKGNDGEFYFGEWKKGHRHGWGFSSQPGQLVQSGMWRNGRFRGERMVYTPDRVYGIDISRYQHERKGRVYGIDWKKLRITYLAADRPVQGKVDYPVSYVYIKSTQGTDILNRYYKKDIRQARQHGYAVGSYHFFSTRESGLSQAAYFLKQSVIDGSDLPPMLDVEPSDLRVKEMGGDSVLVRQIKIWLETVERATGKRPVIYSYQRFIDDHLASSKELLQEYPVWVARYGEYKPYYRLLHWQLTSTGKVQGIQGDVDVNVFNGTKEQFRDYLNHVQDAVK